MRATGAGRGRGWAWPASALVLALASAGILATGPAGGMQVVPVRPTTPPGPAAPGQAAPAPVPAPAPAPPKVESVEQAETILDGMIAEIGQGECFKLDYEAAKAAFARLEAVRPFKDRISDKHAKLYHAGVGGIGLIAGEPQAALVGCKFMTELEKGDPWAVRGYMAAQFVGDKAAGKELLTKMGEQTARRLAQEADLFGGKMPPTNLDLSDGRRVQRFRLPRADRVLVFNFWAVLEKDAYDQFLPSLRALNETYKKHAAFCMIQVNLNPASSRQMVIDYLRTKDLPGLHYGDGQSFSGPLYKDVFGLKNQLCLAVVGPDGLIMFRGVSNDGYFNCAIHAGLRQIEKAAEARTARPPTSQPDRPAAAPAPVTPAPVAASHSPTERARELLNLADTYRAAGMAERANELLQQVIKDYPETLEAAQARKALGQQ